MGETPTPPRDIITEVQELLVSFGLPALIIIVCALLLWAGIDGDVKAILAIAAGWIFKSAYSKAKS
jgi:hypothetical protein